MAARDRRWSRGVRLHPGRLKDHGYSTSEGEERRHEALLRAERANGYATTIRELNYIHNVGSPEYDSHARRIALEDERWLRRRHEREG